MHGRQIRVCVGRCPQYSDRGDDVAVVPQYTIKFFYVMVRFHAQYSNRMGYSAERASRCDELLTNRRLSLTTIALQVRASFASECQIGLWSGWTASHDKDAEQLSVLL